MMMQKSKLLIPAIALVLLSACGERISEVESRMAQIRSERAPPIEPPPVPQPIQEFEYSASGMRSPFLPHSLLVMQTKSENVEGVKPDTSRPKQPLESYELAELIYRGKVVAPNGTEYGLIQEPSGMVREVQVGQYMGKNFGRILEITPTQINLEEIVPGTDSQFVHKRTSVITPN